MQRVSQNVRIVHTSMEGMRVANTLALLISLGSGVAGTVPPPGIERLSRLDFLPRFHDSVRIGMVSSYDRSGGNDDGFSGKYSVIRREEAGLVIAELQGPGIIYRMWTPTPTDDIVEFYFDGEAAPRLHLKFSDLFSGATAPFLRPVAGSGLGGYYSYVPIPYERSCKIVIKAARFHFYQINYAAYPESAGIRTFRWPQAELDRSHLARAQQVFEAAGADISSHVVAPGSRIRKQAFRGELRPGGKLTLVEIKKPGRIAGLRIGPARALGGKTRDVLIRFFWDGSATPAIEVPVGDLFGYGWGQPSMQSLFAGTRDDVNYFYLPAPFSRSAKIELLSQSNRVTDHLAIEGEVLWTDEGRRADEGRLYAHWRRIANHERSAILLAEATGQGTSGRSDSSGTGHGRRIDALL